MSTSFGSQFEIQQDIAKEENHTIFLEGVLKDLKDSIHVLKLRKNIIIKQKIGGSVSSGGIQLSPKNDNSPKLANTKALSRALSHKASSIGRGHKINKRFEVSFTGYHQYLTLNHCHSKSNENLSITELKIQDKHKLLQPNYPIINLERVPKLRQITTNSAENSRESNRNSDPGPQKYDLKKKDYNNRIIKRNSLLKCPSSLIIHDKDKNRNEKYQLPSKKYWQKDQTKQKYRKLGSSRGGKQMSSLKKLFSGLKEKKRNKSNSSNKSLKNRMQSNLGSRRLSAINTIFREEKMKNFSFQLQLSNTVFRKTNSDYKQSPIMFTPKGVTQNDYKKIPKNGIKSKFAESNSKFGDLFQIRTIKDQKKKKISNPSKFFSKKFLKNTNTQQGKKLFNTSKNSPVFRQNHTLKQLKDRLDRIEARKLKL